jgi:hypothetical protein
MSDNPLVVGGKDADTKNRLDHINQPPRLRPARDRSDWERLLVQENVIGSSLLTEAAKQFSYDFTFTSSDWNTVTWTGGSLDFADGTSYTISSGTTGNMGTTAVRYIYFDSAVSSTVLQVTTDESLLASDTALLLCTTRRAISTSSSAFMVPYIGVMAVSDVNIQANSISANMVQANAITASKISVTDLAAISATLGTMTSATAAFTSGCKFYTGGGAGSGDRVEIADEIRLYDGAALALTIDPDGGVGAPLIQGAGLKISTSSGSIIIDAVSSIEMDSTTAVWEASSSMRFESTGSFIDIDGTTAVALEISNVDRVLVNQTGIGFFNTTPVAQPDITGSRGGNAALASLLTAGANLGLWTDSTT